MIALEKKVTELFARHFNTTSGATFNRDMSKNLHLHFITAFIVAPGTI